MKRIFLILLTTALLFSCGKNGGKDLELQQFNKIEVKEFKKKNVRIYTSLRFLNPNPFSVKITYAEFDILINGKDVGTFISKNTKAVPENGLYELPISLDFLPEDAFKDLDYGVLKIKSDIVANVEISGFLQTTYNEKEEEVKFSGKQKVLFSNNAKLFLDDSGNLQEL